MTSVEPGDVVRLSSFEHRQKREDGRENRMGFSVGKGKKDRFVLLVLGLDRDNGADFDPNEALRGLGWTLEEEPVDGKHSEVAEIRRLRKIIQRRDELRKSIIGDVNALRTYISVYLQRFPIHKALLEECTNRIDHIERELREKKP